MDNKKDISSQSPAPHEAGALSDKSGINHSPIDYFAKDENFVFVYKKTEKLATALYMVTNLFGDTEPMKWTLRSRTSHLLSFIIGFKDVLSSRQDEFSYEVKAKVLEIVSLLEIASRAGLVSQMNFSILKSEFMALVNFLSSAKKGENHYANIGGDFFESRREVSVPVRPKNESLPRQFVQRQSSVLESPRNPKKRSDRQETIITLLKKKKEITIHDAAELIPDCSEKTIQRELISLIEMGVVRKTGERRWSKYYLIHEE